MADYFNTIVHVLLVAFLGGAPIALIFGVAIRFIRNRHGFKACLAVFAAEVVILSVGFHYFASFMISEMKAQDVSGPVGLAVGVFLGWMIFAFVGAIVMNAIGLVFEFRNARLEGARSL